MSPDHHNQLVKNIEDMPILPKHRVGLDYDQMKILTVSIQSEGERASRIWKAL